MRVAVRPTYWPGRSGGVEQYVQGLAAGLGALEGDDRYDFTGSAAHQAALGPFLTGPASFVPVPSTAAASSQLLVRVSRTRAGEAVLRMRRRLRPVVGPPLVPDLVDSNHYDVVHFPAQRGETTRHPTVYQPWDLQHLHYPQFFSAEELQTRAALYGPCSERARFVLVASQFVRDDVVNAFDLAPEQVAVVAPGAPTTLHAVTPAFDAVPRVPFALYPAQTWEHKNHIRLLDAVRLLRDRGIAMHLVCPGQANPRLGTVRRHAADAGLGDLVSFPGYLSDAELAGLYERARCLVFPSLFEGFGFPVLEAFVAGLPVACASATSLTELAGDAAVLFDATDIDSIAEAVREVWEDDVRRVELAELGRERASFYTWGHLARACRALYRVAAGAPLEAGDQTLLEQAGVPA